MNGDRDTVAMPSVEIFQNEGLMGLPSSHLGFWELWFNWSIVKRLALSWPPHCHELVIRLTV